MKHIEIVTEVLNLEAQALQEAASRIDQECIDRLVEFLGNLIKSGGNLIFCGVGKSGAVANKLASSFCSLGQPSFCLHPTEALHGDLGRVSPSDFVVFLSKSGSSEEILKLIPFLKIPKTHRAGLLGNLNSPISKECHLVLDCSVEKEACINNLAPTTSTTLAMAMGDAMAVLYENMVNLTHEVFAINHPAGLLGKSLSMKVSDLMWKRSDCPVVSSQATLREVILEMTRINVGGCAVLAADDSMLGIVVEGDIRRTFTRENMGLETVVTEIMNKAPVWIEPNDLAFSALESMEKRETQISLLPVVEADNKFVGFIRLHDLLKEGFVV